MVVLVQRLGNRPVAVVDAVHRDPADEEVLVHRARVDTLDRPVVAEGVVQCWGSWVDYSYWRAEVEAVAWVAEEAVPQGPPSWDRPNIQNSPNKQNRHHWELDCIHHIHPMTVPCWNWFVETCESRC